MHRKGRRDGGEERDGGGVVRPRQEFGESSREYSMARSTATAEDLHTIPMQLKVVEPTKFAKQRAAAKAYACNRGRVMV